MINLKHGDIIKGGKNSKACPLVTVRGMETAYSMATRGRFSMARTSSEINDEADAKHAWARAEGYETAMCYGSSIPVGISDLDWAQRAAKQLNLESRAIMVEHGKLYLIEGEILKAVVHGDKFSNCVVFRKIC